MGLIGSRAIIIGTIIVLWMGWGIGNNLVTWSKPTYACLGGKHITAVGDPVTWLQIGDLQLKYQPFSFDCDKLHQYDPHEYQVKDGLLIPIPH